MGAVIAEMVPCYAPLLENYDYKICMGGRGAGRSVNAMIAIAKNCSEAAIRVIMFREFQASIADSCKAELENVITGMGLAHEWLFLKYCLLHKVTKSVVLFKGMARNPAGIKSTSKIDIACIEECETVSAESLNMLLPTVREDGAELWALGNPKDRTSAIAQMFLENPPPPNTVIIRSTYLDNPFCSKRFIAQAETMRQNDYAMYRHVFLGEYLDKGSCKMIPMVVMDDGTTQVGASDVCIVGVDIAREGDDKTVICVRKGKKIVSLESYSDMDLPKLTAELVRVNRLFNPHRINIDSTGHGSWCPDGLRAMGIKAYAYNFSESADKDKEYGNKRTEMYAKAAEYFGMGGTIPATATRLREDLEASYFTLDNKNRRAMISKKEIKKDIGRSPDDGDAFCLCMVNPQGIFAAPRPEIDAQRQSVLARDLMNAGSYGGKYI